MAKKREKKKTLDELYYERLGRREKSKKRSAIIDIPKEYESKIKALSRLLRDKKYLEDQINGFRKDLLPLFISLFTEAFKKWGLQTYWLGEELRFTFVFRPKDLVDFPKEIKGVEKEVLLKLKVREGDEALVKKLLEQYPDAELKILVKATDIQEVIEKGLLDKVASLSLYI